MFSKKVKTFKAPLPVSAERKRMQVGLEQLIQDLRDAMGGDMPERLAAVIRNLAEHSGDIEKAVVVWVRLIEILVQNADRGRATGQGALKKSDVKAAVHYIISSNQFEVPLLPRYLQPLILDFLADWTIEMIVFETNRYGLWAEEPPEPVTIFSILRMAIKRFKVWTRPFWDWIGGILAVIYTAVRYSEPLSPELKKALEDVEAQGFFIDKRDFLKTGVETVIFIGTHGTQVIAIGHVVFGAVREAERFANLSGPEKKQYAQDAVLTVLAELGFPVDSGIIGAIIRSLVDGAIESAVDIFNRRAPEMFASRRTA